MKEYSTSLFDDEKPFEIIRAEDLGEDLSQFYEPLEEIIKKVTGVDIKGSTRPVFLVGGQGTGKTMMLKFLSFDMQLKDYNRNRSNISANNDEFLNETMLNFLNVKDFLGVYLHFRTTEYDMIKGEFSPFFQPYLSIKFAEKILKICATIKASKIFTTLQETAIVNFFLRQLDDVDKTKVFTFEDCLVLIREEILPRYEFIFQKSAIYSLEEIKKRTTIPIVNVKNIFFDFPGFIFSSNESLINKKLFILFDELEFLSEEHKRFIGQLVKDSDETCVKFKIGSRYMPEKMYVGDSSVVLKEVHDFRKILIVDSLNDAHSNRKSDYKNLIKKILNKRLEKSEYFKKKHVTDIDSLLPSLSMEDEARLLVRGRNKHWREFKKILKRENNYSDKKIEKIIFDLKYSENPIIEKLNMLLFYRGYNVSEIRNELYNYKDDNNDTYKELYKKNSLNLLFQLSSDYGQYKKYVGIDIFIHLSSGIVRNVIELCNIALNTACNYNQETQLEKGVSPNIQDISAKQLAQTAFDDITSIQKYGLEVQDLINNLGAIFRALHVNKNIIEPEPTHFEVKYLNIKGISKEIFDAALDYSYLQEKPAIQPKQIYKTKGDDFVINKVLSPKFNISYRVRGKITIYHQQIIDLITGEEKLKEKTVKDIINQNKKKINNLKQKKIGFPEE
jgi:hypothetical protein